VWRRSYEYEYENQCENQCEYSYQYEYRSHPGCLLPARNGAQSQPITIHRKGENKRRMENLSQFLQADTDDHYEYENEQCETSYE